MFNLLFHFIRSFSLSCFGCVLFSKVDYCVFGFSFDFLLILLVSIKLERGFQKNKLYSFNLGLIQFGCRGAFFFIHADSGFLALISCVG